MVLPVAPRLIPGKQVAANWATSTRLTGKESRMKETGITAIRKARSLLSWRQAA
jgi:hypothetical protein